MEKLFRINYKKIPLATVDYEKKNTIYSFCSILGQFDILYAILNN